MSQRDLVAELHGARIPAPAHVREHVRQIVAGAPAPPRRFTWRRALVVAVPAFAAVAAAVLITRPGSEPTATPTAPVELQAQAAQHGAAAKSFATPATGTGGTTRDALAPAPAPGRVSRYGAFLSLRVDSANGVSNGVKRALQVATSLGGFSTSVHASTEGKAATADLTLRIPRAHIQEAISRLSALGTITGEQVDVQDVQAGLDATSRTIARLQRQLKRLRAQEQTPSVIANTATITARVARLQRQEAAAIRSARFATIRLHLATKERVVVHHARGPLHGLGVAFHWTWIGAIYAAALGAPLVVLLVLIWLAVRTARRRREDALLSRL
jgi:hypothetical protein